MNRNYTSGQGGIVGRLRTGKGILHITECYGKYNKTTEGRHGNMKPGQAEDYGKYSENAYNGRL